MNWKKRYENVEGQGEGQAFDLLALARSYL